MGLTSAYLQQAYKRKSIAQVVDIWTNHAYAGDYNPLHDHNAIPHKVDCLVSSG